jgi:hypothetical protein
MSSQGPILGVAALITALGCTPEPTHKKFDGSVTLGGAGGSGGASDTGGSGGGTGGSGGSAGTGGLGGGGGFPFKFDGAVPGLDGGRQEGGAAAVTFNTINNDILSNCVFCHPGMGNKQTSFDPSTPGLYDRLTKEMDKAIPANCPIKMIVAPGKPMMSLLYLKIAGMQPATCGVRMPRNQTPLIKTEIDKVFNWIMAGAPP